MNTSSKNDLQRLTSVLIYAIFALVSCYWLFGISVRVFYLSVSKVIPHSLVCITLGIINLAVFVTISSLAKVTYNGRLRLTWFILIVILSLICISSLNWSAWMNDLWAAKSLLN